MNRLSLACVFAVCFVPLLFAFEIAQCFYMYLEYLNFQVKSSQSLLSLSINSQSFLRLKQASVAEQSGLCLTWSETGFLATGFSSLRQREKRLCQILVYIKCHLYLV